MRLLEVGETNFMYQCACVNPRSGLGKGTLLVGEELLYDLIAGFTLVQRPEVSDIDGLPPDRHELMIPVDCGFLARLP